MRFTVGGESVCLRSVVVAITLLVLALGVIILVVIGSSMLILVVGVAVTMSVAVVAIVIMVLLDRLGVRVAGHRAMVCQFTQSLHPSAQVSILTQTQTSTKGMSTHLNTNPCS